MPAPGLTGWSAHGAAFGLGAVAAAGQAPLGFWWMALPAYAAMTLLVVQAPGPRVAALRAFWAGTGHFALALSWIVEPFLVDAPRNGWMAPFALVLMSGGLALFWAAAGGLAALTRRPALGFAAALAGAEMLRGHIFTGFPWALPGHIWIDTPVSQAAAVVGGYGLTLATLALAALPVALGWRGTATAGVLVGLAWAGGLWRLAEIVPPGPGAPVVRLVQPATAQSDKWDADLARATFDRLLQMTRAPAGIRRPDLVVWPETSVPYLLDRSPGVVREIAAAGMGAPVAVGVQRSDGVRRYWNSLAVIAPDGQVAALYDKFHLVPFGEYLPLGEFLWNRFGIAALAASEGNGYSAGPGPAVLDLGPALGRVLPLICYEAIFPGIPRAAPERPGWMVHITNDAWFGKLSGPYQHLALSRLRAIEQGLPLVRVGNTGISTVIDARGRMGAVMPLGYRGFIDAALPPPDPPTPYSRTGEVPTLLLLALLALAAGFRRRT